MYKYKLNCPNRICSVVAITTLVGLVSCSSVLGPNWDDIGIQQVNVLWLELDDVASANDTLTLIIVGAPRTGGNPTLDRIDAVPDSSRVELTIWARVKKWVGSGTMPPYDTTVRCVYSIPPPLETGYYYVIIHQSDGSTFVDSVLVVE